jgi:cobalt-zinc-cadmium efflux system membrane fusion protein
MKNNLIIFLPILTVIFVCCGTGRNSDKSNASELTELNAEEELHQQEPDHTVLVLKKQKFAFIVETGGMLISSGKDHQVVSAKSPGIVNFHGKYILPGTTVSEKQPLFTISGWQLAGDNTDLKFMQIKADLEKAKANYERADSLITDMLITRKEYLDFKNEYEKVLIEYKNLNETYGDAGNIIFSPVTGYIKDIFVQEGQIVATGDPLASIICSSYLILKADLPPKYLSLLPSIKKANFRVGYSDRIFKNVELNGKIISAGKSIDESSFYIPVFFRIDYDPQLIEGTYAEVFLIGKEKDDALVVPNSALMEEFGKTYVFIEAAEGSFVKRYISTGFGDGESTEVVDGLLENETIVATGAYNIKLATINATMPAHSHNH